MKESNALVISSSQKSSQPELCRVIMNDKYFSSYKIEDSDYTNPFISLNLDESNFSSSVFDCHIIEIANFPSIVQNKDTCFKVSNSSTEAIICQISFNTLDFVSEWEYDFNLFKNQCKKKHINKTPLDEEDISSNIDNKTENSESVDLKNELKSELEQVKEDLSKEKQQLMEEHDYEEKKLELTKQIESVENESLLKLEKEARMSSLLELEESVKEDEEEKMLMTKIETEKKKEDCLLKAFEEKALEEKVKLEQQRVSERIKEIKENTNEELIKQREAIKQRIMNMRKKKERRQKQLNQEIVHIRTEMVSKINDLARKGNTSKCLLDPLLEKSKSLRNSYCASIKSDKLRNDCLQPDGFCYSCCENEVGDAFIRDREKCYDECDKRLEKSE